MSNAGISYDLHDTAFPIKRIFEISKNQIDISNLLSEHFPKTRFLTDELITYWIVENPETLNELNKLILENEDDPQNYKLKSSNHR